MTKVRLWALLLASSFACGIASGQPHLADPGDDEPELVALAADMSEEETVHTLERISTQRQLALRRAEVRGQEYVRMVRLGLLPLSGGFEDFVAHANRVEALRRGLARDLSLVRELDERALSVRRSLTAQRERRDRVVRQAENYQRFREAIVAEQEREAAYRRAFASRAANGAHSAIYSSGGGSAAQGTGSFAELRGKVPFPVRGRAEVRELMPSAGAGPAVEMLVEIGAVARSVFKGRVVMLSGSDGEPRTVVVDHGDGYTTLLGNLGRVSVEIGDQVAAGAELGRIAAGLDGRAALRFELRRDGQSLLPAEWFGL